MIDCYSAQIFGVELGQPSHKKAAMAMGICSLHVVSGALKKFFKK